MTIEGLVFVGMALGLAGIVTIIWLLIDLKVEVEQINTRVNIIKEWMWQEAKKDDKEYQAWRKSLNG